MSENGRIILINGPSGSGKTSLCIQLARQLHHPYMHICMDRFYEGLHQYPLTPLQRLQLPAIYHGFLASVAAFVEVGNRVLLDMVLSNTYMKRAMVERLGQLPTCLVGLTCSLNLLEARNTDRDDRRKGLSEEQADHVHANMHYDLLLDTGLRTTVECADRIITYLDRDELPDSMTTLQRELRDAD